MALLKGIKEFGNLFKGKAKDIARTLADGTEELAKDGKNALENISPEFDIDAYVRETAKIGREGLGLEPDDKKMQKDNNKEER